MEVADMALVMCPECGKEISDKASYCIHCGCPIQIVPRNEHHAETERFSGEESHRKANRMSQKQTIIIIALTAFSGLLPLIFRRSELYYYGFRLISFLLSLIPCVAVALLAVFQPKKKELLSVIAMTCGVVINFLTPQFLYREPLTIAGLLNYALLFSMIVIYWLSVVPVINNRVVPIAATIGYAVFCLIMVFTTIGYGSYILGIRLVSSICNMAFYSSVCIIICDSMKYRQRKTIVDTSGAGNYVYVQDAPSTGFAVLCFCFPIVGLILYCVWKETLPKRAKSAGIGGLLGFIIGVVLTILVYVIALLRI